MSTATGKEAVQLSVDYVCMKESMHVRFQPEVEPTEKSPSSLIMYCEVMENVNDPVIGVAIKRYSRRSDRTWY